MCLHRIIRALCAAIAVSLFGLVLEAVVIREAMAAPLQLLGTGGQSVVRRSTPLRVAAEGTLSKRLRAHQLRRDRGSANRRPGGNAAPAKTDQSSASPKRPKDRATLPQCVGGRIVSGACHCSGGGRLSDGICVVQSRPDPVMPRRPGAVGLPLPPPVTSPPPVTTSEKFSPPLSPPANGSGPISPAPAALDASLPFVPDEVLAVLAASMPETTEAAAAARFNLVLLERATLAMLDQRVVRFRIPDARSVAAVVASLAGDATIGVAQPNFIYRPQQAAGSPAQSSLQYAVAKVDLAAARPLAVGRGAIVAVIDTGIDTTHEDLRDSDIRTFETTGSDSSKPDVHGTGIAGIISAHGVLEGIAPAARIIGVRAFAPTEAGVQYSTTVMVLKAMNLALAQQAKVMNLSFAGSADPLMQRAVGAAAGRGAIMVAAAGNNGHLAPPAYPAAYPEVIAVTAVDADDRLYPKANIGGYVALAAPGVDVLVPTPGNSRELESGTSFAAAHVTGIIALLLERNTHLTAAQARAALTGGATDLGGRGRDAEYGAGRANAAASLKLVSTR
jgi:subtilisin family serine protease